MEQGPKAGLQCASPSARDRFIGDVVVRPVGKHGVQHFVAIAGKQCCQIAAQRWRCRIDHALAHRLALASGDQRLCRMYRFANPGVPSELGFQGFWGGGEEAVKRAETVDQPRGDRFGALPGNRSQGGADRRVTRVFRRILTNPIPSNTSPICNHEGARIMIA